MTTNAICQKKPREYYILQNKYKYLLENLHEAAVTEITSQLFSEFTLTFDDKQEVMKGGNKTDRALATRLLDTLLTKARHPTLAPRELLPLLTLSVC